MQPFDWREEDGLWVAPLPGGRASIRETREIGFGVPPGGGYGYDCALELNDGRIYDVFEGFSDFERAAEWCRIRFVDMLAASRGQSVEATLVEALRHVERALPADLPAVYLARLQALRDWVVGNRQPPVPAGGMPAELEWAADGEGGLCAPTPHGEARIWAEQEPARTGVFGAAGRTSYRAAIRHPSGAALELPGHFGDRLRDLDAAQAAVEEAMERLEDPAVEEPQLDALDFSIDIYRRLLPADSEPWVGDYLTYLACYLGTALP